MYCSKCGNKLIENSTFCNNCGFNNNELINKTLPLNKTNTNSKNKLNLDKKQIIILGLLLVIIIMMFIAVSLLDKDSKNKPLGTRTIMIYMAGSNLESDNAIATAELDSINPESVDLTKINVYVYTGGTIKWHNYVDPNENAIYKLTEEGFEKVKTYKKKSLGLSNTFSEFLNYVYSNSDTSNYDLVMWDHGLGALGAISDDNFSDYLNVKEMKQALKSSPFNKENKLSTVSFRTCLNGTIEIASIFADYADYLVASEEITRGATGNSVLNYINVVTTQDTGLTYSKKFIEAYKKQMDIIDPFDSVDSTYSIIDLSKFNILSKELDEFIKDIDFNKYYNEIAKIRSNLHQYAVKEGNIYDYDTIDLGELLSKLKYISSKNAQDVLNILNEMVVYNWTTNKYSNGLAIYFPYNGSENAKQAHLKVYDSLNISKAYKNFINKFYNAQKNATSFNYDLTQNDTKIIENEFTLKLTEDQINNYAKAGYIIFKKNEDGNYQPILNSMDAELTSDGYLKTNISNNLIKISDVEEPYEYDYAMVTKNKDENGNDIYTTTAIIWNLENITDDMHVANITFKIDKNNKPYIADTVIINDNLVGPTVDFNDYDVADFVTSGFKILDSNGKYTENWETHNVKYFFEISPKEKDYTLSLDYLNNDGNEYYCIFKVFDINNNYYYSDLIKIN